MVRLHQYIQFLQGLDYPGVGPGYTYLKDIGRVEYVPVTDEEVVTAFEYLSKWKVLFLSLKVPMPLPLS